MNFILPTFSIWNNPPRNHRSTIDNTAFNEILPSKTCANGRVRKKAEVGWKGRWGGAWSAKGSGVAPFKSPPLCWQCRCDCDRCVAARVPLKGRFRSPRVPSPRPPTARALIHRWKTNTGACHRGSPFTLSIPSLSLSPLLLSSALLVQMRGTRNGGDPPSRTASADINLVFTRRIARIPASMRIGQFTRSLERLVFPLALRNLSLRQVKHTEGRGGY